MTIAELRKSKTVKIKVFHYRNANVFKDLIELFPQKDIYGPDRLPKGGKTEISITNCETGLTYQGIAECSNNDAFNRKLGNKIALNRALKNMKENVIFSSL